jgi:hypothetical protein
VGDGNRYIVVALREALAGLEQGSAYLDRARPICATAEVLGARLIAWGPDALALSWDQDSLEEAVSLATSIGKELEPLQHAWACGMAEGELEPLSTEGQRMHLAWGEALSSAMALARVARAGEVLLDGSLAAAQGSPLAILGIRSGAEGGRRVRGWRLDVANPWKRPAPAGHVDLPEAAQTDKVLPADLPSSDVVEAAEAAEAAVSAEEPEGPTLRPPAAAWAREGLSELRRVRAHAEEEPAPVRCRAGLALAMGLSVAGRSEEALLEGLDALARGREAQDPAAIAACVAFLAKLYGGVGKAEAAASLRRLASASPLMPSGERPVGSVESNSDD